MTAAAAAAGASGTGGAGAGAGGDAGSGAHAAPPPPSVVPLDDPHAVLKKAGVLTSSQGDGHERAPRRRLSSDTDAGTSAPADAAAATSSSCLPPTSALPEAHVTGGAGTLQMPNAQRLRDADPVYI